MFEVDRIQLYRRGDEPHNDQPVRACSTLYEPPSSQARAVLL